MIVDDRYVLVSSINWNSNSPNFNREAGVIIDHPGVARYFLDVFEDDWNSMVKSPGVKTDYLKIVVVASGISHSHPPLLSPSKEYDSVSNSQDSKEENRIQKYQ